MAEKETKRIMRVTDEEKERIMESAKQNMVPRNSFYTKPDKYYTVSRFDRASNRRAASRYIPNA